MKVLNLSFLEYINLEDRTEFDYYLNYGDLKANDLFQIGLFEDLTFGFVKDMQEILNYSGLTWQSFFEEVRKYTGIKENELVEYSIFELQKARYYFKEQIEYINELENKNLSYSPTIQEEQAGLDDFQKYRSFIQFDKLTNGDLTKIDQVRELKYSLCFAKLMLERDKLAYQDRYSRLNKKT